MQESRVAMENQMESEMGATSLGLKVQESCLG